MVSSVVILRKIDQRRAPQSLQEMLYISSPTLLRHLSLGYEGLLADIYWTRVVQYFGSKHSRGEASYQLLWPLLEIATQLDPHLIPAYEFGGTFLLAKPPEGAGSPQQAIKLVEYGIENNPHDWHLYYDLAFIYYDLKDYRRAAEAVLRGSRTPNAQPLLKVMAAQMAEHGGDLKTARMMWSATYQTTHDPMVRANAAAHLRALQVDQDVEALEQLVALYRSRTGREPTGFAEIEKAGYLRGIPLDPLGKPYELSRDGHVYVRDPEDLPFLERGLRPGYVPPARPKLLPDG
jgi:tetratricopeptide (TPR) repeat protein